MRHEKIWSSGFTLIELMISLVIGAIVIGIGLSFYVQTTASRNLLRAELAMQENSHYIDHTLRQLINQTGHRPLIASLLSTDILPVKAPDKSFDATSATDEDGEATADWEQGQFIRVEDNGFSIRFNGASDDTGSADGTLIDCLGVPVAETETADISITVLDGALICTSGGESIELIAEGDGVSVERIAVLWGLDTNNDRSVDEYSYATDSLSIDESLISVRIAMLLSSNKEVSISNSTYAFNGLEFASPDSKLRREVITTVKIKN